MRDGKGIEAASRISAVLPGTPIALLSVYPGAQGRRRGLRGRRYRLLLEGRISRLALVERSTIDQLAVARIRLAPLPATPGEPAPLLTQPVKSIAGELQHTKMIRVLGLQGADQHLELAHAPKILEANVLQEEWPAGEA